MHHWSLRLSFAAALLLAWSTASGGSAADSIAVIDPYARAVPPMQPNSAVFMRLENSGAEHALVAARSQVSDVVELHTHRKVDGMMKMRRIERIGIPAQASTELKPGGLHIMLIGLKRQLEPGQHVPLTLMFEDGSSKDIVVPVRKVMFKMRPPAH